MLVKFDMALCKGFLVLVLHVIGCESHFPSRYVVHSTSRTTPVHIPMTVTIHIDALQEFFSCRAAATFLKATLVPLIVGLNEAIALDANVVNNMSIEHWDDFGSQLLQKNAKNEGRLVAFVARRNPRVEAQCGFIAT